MPDRQSDTNTGLPVFCGYWTIKSWRFRSLWIVEPSTLGSSVAQNTGTVLTV